MSRRIELRPDHRATTAIFDELAAARRRAADGLTKLRLRFLPLQAYSEFTASDGSTHAWGAAWGEMPFGRVSVRFAEQLAALPSRRPLPEGPGVSITSMIPNANPVTRPLDRDARGERYVTVDAGELVPLIDAHYARRAAEHLRAKAPPTARIVIEWY